ncbi:MAG: ParB/RepB/Spo0J family partition protein [Clostridiales bacterium]|nr:ParB/RepB/Spo0J family partition protein [Clostridiales bacterium]
MYQDLELTKKGVFMVSTGDIVPNPDNPRKDLGDLTELTESIRQNGVLQNLLLAENPDESDPRPYMAVLGHRRHASAIAAGVRDVPAIVKKMTRTEMIQAMLQENMQRQDLTPLEEAQSFQMMLDLGETVKSISEATGFSQATVKHRVEIARLDPEKLKAREAETGTQITIGDLAKLEEVKDIGRRNKLLEMIGTSNFNYYVSEAVQKEEYARNEKRIMDLLPEGLKKLKASEPNWKYQIITAWKFKDDTKASDCAIPKKSVPPVYYQKTESAVRIYGAMKEKYAGGKKDSEDPAARKADYESRSAALQEICARMYGLRLDFVKNLPRNILSQKKDAVLQYAARAIAHASGCNLNIVNYYGYTDTDAFWQDHDVFSDPVDWFIEDAPGGGAWKLFITTWAAFDVPRATWHLENSWKTEIVPECCAVKDDAIYSLLMEFGYKMSDEEILIVTGKHELYTPKVGGAGK